MPSLLLGVIIISASIILSVSALLAVRRRVPHHRMKPHNDIAGPMFETMGVAYAVLLAFIVVVVWQNFDKARANVEREANCVTDMVRDSQSFSQGSRQHIQGLIRQYAELVSGEEWAAMAKGRASARVSGVLNKMWDFYGSYEPATISERIFFEESVRHLDEVGELRRMRLFDAKSGLHPVLWFVLITGGVSIMLFALFFGAENLRSQVLMIALLSVSISLILFLILVFDYPFSGDVSVSADAFKEMLQY
ncbi:MAG: DUF4239 domain-containing protein [Candidatus Omnitrophota bacterium]